MTATKATRLTPDQIAATLHQYRDLAWWAARYVAAGRVAGEELIEELAAEATCKMCDACRTYDPSRGWAFNTYVTRGLIAYLVRYLHKLNTGGLTGGRAGGASANRPKSIASLNVERDAEQEDGGLTLAVTIPDRESVVPFEPPPDLWERVSSVLPGNWLRVLRMRFVERLTLAKCGVRLGLSRERVRQIEMKAFLRVRDALPTLEQYLESE